MPHFLVTPCLVVAVHNDSSDLFCFELYLINVFAKSTKKERYADVMFKLTLIVYLLLLKIHIFIEDIDMKI